MNPSVPSDSGRRIRGWIKLVIIVYCAAGIALYYLQDFILFHPHPVGKNKRYAFNNAYKEINIPYDGVSNLSLVEFKTDSLEARGVVLYFHGNKNNISWYAKFAPLFTRNGYELWMMDYPGYGKSTGKFTEDRLYEYALQVYKLARATYKPNQIILYGKSLGSGIAAQLAAVRDCKRLILETPYYSMESLIRHFLPIYPVGHMLHYHLSTALYLPKITAPVSIFHGTNDWLIPYSNAKRLIPLLKPGDEFISIDKGTHNDLAEFPLFQQKLDSLLSL